VAAIEQGFFQKELADFAYDTAMRKASGDKPVIGVNKYVEEGAPEPEVEVHRVDPETERQQIENLRRVKAERDAGLVERQLRSLQEAARDERVNVMPVAIECVKARCTMGEMVGALKEVWGSYTEAPVF
jgi:methylmalonyl-CoA mutase N-terminal domain/subunit